MGDPEMNLSGIVSRFPDAVDAVFYKMLTSNDDSGRHGVLIPATSYAFFPVIAVDGTPNPSVPITTHWNDGHHWVAQDSFFRQYDRYPERRITSLSPGHVNLPAELRLLIVARSAADQNQFYCLVTTPAERLFGEARAALRMPERSVRPGGAAATISVEGDAYRPSVAFNNLLARLQEIAALGPIPSMRQGSTGIGFTLESLLGIPANSSQAGGDILGIELKATRSRYPLSRRGKAGGSVTLLAKTPDWGPNGDRVGLLDRHGYVDKDGRFALYMSIFAQRPNPMGWSLEPDDDERQLWATRDGLHEVSWTYDALERRIQEKHRESAFVTAFAQAGIEVETFLFDHVLHCSGPSLENFLKMVSDRHVFVDFAMHRTASGGVRDHGFLFRTNQGHVPLLFETVESFGLA